MMRELIYITKALADRNRVRALYALQAGELCVCQITAFLGLSPSTVSKHMSILRHAGLVDTRKEGRWMYYKLTDSDTPTAARRALTWVRETLAGDPGTARDRKRLKTVLKINPTQLCKRQCCAKAR